MFGDDDLNDWEDEQVFQDGVLERMEDEEWDDEEDGGDWYEDTEWEEQDNWDDIEYQEIVDQGIRNYMEGDGQGHNPYSDETKEYWAWDEGWLAAKENMG